jgi:hypothetical protein
MVAAKRKSNATESVAEWAALEDLPNVGKAIAADFRVLGIRTPRQLRHRDPYALYRTPQGGAGALRAARGCDPGGGEAGDARTEHNARPVRRRRARQVVERSTRKRRST